MKKRLGQLTSEAFFYRDEIKEKKALLAKSESDLVVVGEERDRAFREGRRLKFKLKKAEGSGGGAGMGVLDYLNQKAEEAELVGQKATLKKKAELAHVAWVKAKSVSRHQGLHV